MVNILQIFFSIILNNIEGMCKLIPPYTQIQDIVCTGCKRVLLKANNNLEVERVILTDQMRCTVHINN